MEYLDDFSAMIAEADIIQDEIRDSAEMNYLRWDTLGKINPKVGGGNFHETFDEAVSAVKTWLKGREDHFKIADCVVVTSEVSEDCRTIDTYFDDGKSHQDVRFAVWNVASEPRVVLWFPAELVDGVWHSTIDMTQFNMTGVYSMDAYVDGDTFAITNGFNYVEKLP